MPDNIATEETAVELPKESRVKKFLKNPKQLAIAGGAVLLATAAVVVFALKRSDEEDFDTEFPEEPTAPSTEV